MRALEQTGAARKSSILRRGHADFGLWVATEEPSHAARSIAAEIEVGIEAAAASVVTVSAGLGGGRVRFIYFQLKR